MFCRPRAPSTGCFFIPRLALGEASPPPDPPTYRNSMTVWQTGVRRWVLDDCVGYYCARSADLCGQFDAERLGKPGMTFVGNCKGAGVPQACEPAEFEAPLRQRGAER